MGIQIHSHPVHRTVVETIQSGAIGKVKTVHSWSGKNWGDKDPRPTREDSVPEKMNWDGWLGVASARPFIAGYYHPGEWRKRLDFGTGTFGDMGCHILDPVFGSLALTAPKSVRSDGDETNADSWGLDNRVVYIFPETPQTDGELTVHWYNGSPRPPEEVKALIGTRRLASQGSIYIGTDGVLYSPYISMPVLLPEEKFKETKLPTPGGNDHYLQFVEACRGNGTTSAPFAYSGPLSEMVLLGCLSTRFPKTPARMGRGQPQGDQHRRGQRLRPQDLPKRLGCRGDLNRRPSGIIRCHRPIRRDGILGSGGESLLHLGWLLARHVRRSELPAPVDDARLQQRLTELFGRHRLRSLDDDLQGVGHFRRDDDRSRLGRGDSSPRSAWPFP